MADDSTRTTTIPEPDKGILMRRPRREAGSSRLGAALAVVGVLAAVLALDGGAVNAQLGPPQRDEPLAAVWLSVGEVREVDVSAAFSGLVDSYTASSDNTAAVGVSVTGSVVRLTSVAAGVAFVEVRAGNAGGSASQWIGVVSRAAEVGDEDLAPDSGNADEMLPLEDDDQPSDAGVIQDNDGAGPVPGAVAPSPAIALVSQAWCFTWEMHGMFMPDTDELPPLDRNEVERFSLSFWVVGGRPPYVVTSPDAHAPVSSAAGVLRIACGIPTSSSANPGERAYLPRDAGPLTITVSVTDADGATGSAEVVVVMSPGALSFLRDDGVCREIVEVPGMEKPGHTYVLGTSSVWTLVTLAPSLDLRFEGLDGNGIATFADRETGWEIRLDWLTGAEVSRTVGEFPGTDPTILSERRPTLGGGINSTTGELFLAC